MLENGNTNALIRPKLGATATNATDIRVPVVEEHQDGFRVHTKLA